MILELRNSKRIDVHIEEQLPEDGEHDALQAVGEDTRAQASGEEAKDAICGDDSFGGLRCN